MQRLRRAAVSVGLAVGLAATLAGTPVSGSVAHADTSAPTAKSAGWTRVFFDDFDSLAGSTAKWSNTAPQKLPDSSCWTFRKVADRSVVVVTSNKPWEKPGAVSCRMATNQSFGGATHKFSARVKFHRKGGTLSSFWVTGPGPNEIDIIENAGRKPRNGNPCVLKRHRSDISRHKESSPRFYGLMHNVYHSYGPHAGHRSCLAKPLAHGLYDGKFHTVTAIWRPGAGVDFEVDGRRTVTFKAKWSRTSAVNALLTNKSVNPNGVGFVVDWVKVWQSS